MAALLVADDDEGLSLQGRPAGFSLVFALKPAGTKLIDVPASCSIVKCGFSPLFE